MSLLILCRPAALLLGVHAGLSGVFDINGTYTLSRYLLIYVNKKPGEPLDTLTREFIKFIVSKDGQEIVTKDGYYPIPAKVSAEVLKSIE